MVRGVQGGVGWGGLWDYRKGWMSMMIRNERRIIGMIEFHKVTKRYGKGRKGVDNTNVKFEEGEFIGVVGVCGGGK